MAYTAGDVMDLAAALLNDAAKALYTYTVQFPFLRLANDELDLALSEEGISIGNARADINVAANATTVTLPADFFIPIALKERVQTSTDDNEFVDMTEKDFEPSTQRTDTLNYWAFRNNAINLVGATANRTVRLFYKRTLAAITNINGSETEEVLKAKNFLAMRTGALCAEFIGGTAGKGRADSLNLQGVQNLNMLLDIYVKSNQGNRVRRKPFRITNRLGIKVSVG